MGKLNREELEGTFSDVRCYDRALSNAELLWLFMAGPNENAPEIGFRRIKTKDALPKMTKADIECLKEN